MERRYLWWPVLAIGLALVIAPFALSLPSKADAGEQMLNNFQPIMQPASVQTTADYYYNTFVPLGKIVPAMGPATVQKFDAYLTGLSGMQTDAAKLVPLLSQALNMSPAQVQAMMTAQLPSMAAMLKGLPQMQKDFGGMVTLLKTNQPIFANVPPGLAHYKPLVDTMQANVQNYKDVNSLPSFRLFTWFFVVPGVLLVLLSGWALLEPTAKRHVHFHQPHPAA